MLDDVILRLGEVAKVGGEEDILLQYLVHGIVEGLGPDGIETFWLEK